MRPSKPSKRCFTERGTPKRRIISPITDVVNSTVGPLTARKGWVGRHRGDGTVADQRLQPLHSCEAAVHYLQQGEIWLHKVAETGRLPAAVLGKVRTLVGHNAVPAESHARARRTASLKSPHKPMPEALRTLSERRRSIDHQINRYQTRSRLEGVFELYKAADHEGTTPHLTRAGLQRAADEIGLKEFSLGDIRKAHTS